jgi:HK97 family phage prohead protease
MEYKVLVSQPKSIEGRIVIGLAAVTGNVDSGADRIRHGAFKKTIRENGRRVKHLWMHDMWQPPTAVIKELVEVGVDGLPDGLKESNPEVTGGLQVTREYLETPRGDEILAGLKAGSITEMSFGYDAVKFDYEEIQDGDHKFMVRNLKEIRLWDTSDVNLGMNELTVAAKRSLAPLLPAYEERMPKEQYVLLNGLVTTVQSALDADALKAGRVLSARNLERLKTALDTLSEILLSAEPEEEDSEKLLALTEQIRSRLSIAEREISYLGVGG